MINRFLTKARLASLSIFLLLVALMSCEEKQLDNPYDAESEFERFKISDFKSEDSSIEINALSWSFNKQKPDSFLVERKVDTNEWDIYTYLNSDALTFTDSAVIPDLTYGYRISTVYDQNIIPSEILWIDNLFHDPSDVSFEKISDKSFRIIWKDNSIGEEGFIINRKLDSDPYYDSIGFAAENTTSFIDTNVFNSSSKEIFDYRVDAFFKGYYAYGGYADNVLAKMDAPSNINFESIAIDKVRITWQDNSDGEDGFVVQRSDDGYTFEEVTRVSGNQLIDSTFTPNSQVRYHIYPYVGSTGFGYTSATYDAAVPKPHDFNINLPSIDIAELSWQFYDIEHEGFKIYRQSADYSWEEIGYTEEKQFTDTGFDFNRLVDYRVVALVEGYESDPAQDYIYSEFGGPDYLQINATSSTAVYLSWDDDYDGEDGFKLDIRINQDPWQEEFLVLSENTTSKTITNLDLTNNVYYFRVYAYIADYETSTEWNSIKTYIDYVHVTGGSFQMGCNTGMPSCNSDALPVHTVNVDDFNIGKYEITNSQFVSYLNNIGCESNGFYDGLKLLNIQNQNCKIEHNGTEFLSVDSYENHPAIEVTWHGANGYAEWAGGRLPTEAEWEYSARGGQYSSEYIYSGNNTLDEVGWWQGNTSDTHPVGQKQPNEIGIYDMSGNAWEWVNDWYRNDYYEESPVDNPQGPSGGSIKVIRGGAVPEEEANCTVAFRSSLFPEFGGYNGFRVAND